MKTTILFVLLAICGLSAKGQDALAHSVDFTAGVMLTGGVCYVAKDKSVSKLYSIAPSLNVVLSKTHHHVMYDLPSATAQTLNGFFIGKNYDVYHFFQQSVKSSDRYTSIGIEKYIPFKKIPWLDLMIFSEIGSDFHGTTSITVGFTLHPQIKL